MTDEGAGEGPHCSWFCDLIISWRTELTMKESWHEISASAGTYSTTCLGTRPSKVQPWIEQSIEQSIEH